MFNFLKSKTFWLSVAHVAVVGTGAYASYSTGHPFALVLSGGVNALLGSPLPSPGDAAKEK
jgi:hypothetical protein